MDLFENTVTEDAEVLKYAFLEKSSGSPLNYRLFDFLKQNKDDILNLNPSVMIQLVNICCSIKSYVVNQDETEKWLIQLKPYYKAKIVDVKRKLNMV